MDNFESATQSVPGTAKVIVPKAIEVVQDGKSLGWVDAEYDFSHLPEGLHGLALMAIKMPTRIILAL